MQTHPLRQSPRRVRRARIRGAPTTVALCAVLTWVLHGVALGGTLKIETQTTVGVTGDFLSVCVTFANWGTAAAHDLRVHVSLPGATEAGPVKARLEPEESEHVCFEKEFGSLKSGRYPLTVRVDFHDANDYPFSALSCTTFRVGEERETELESLGRDITLRTTGVLTFNLNNAGGAPKEIHGNLVLPKEFETPEPSVSTYLDSGSEKEITFELRNTSALAGAKYPVFLTCEYDEEGTHHTVIARARVTTAEDINWFRRTKRIWLGLAALLGALLFFEIINDFRKKRRGLSP